MLAPLAVALAAMACAGRGAPLPVPVLAGIAAAVLVGIAALAYRRSLALAVLAVALDGGLLAFLHTFAPAPLSAPVPYAGPLPPAAPPASLAAYRIETGVIHRSAAFAYRGGSPDDHRDFAMTAVLVRHPQGDILIDAGLGRTLPAQLGAMPLPFQLLTNAAPGTPAADQLAAAHVTPKAILLTHAHWDHASGAVDLPDVPVWVAPEEVPFIANGGWLTAIARSLPRVEPIDFEGGDYLGFPRHHDVFGDGSLVIVPAPGHTPGSVIAFLTLPTGTRYAFVGDLVWQREGITEREERPWFVRASGDVDEAATRAAILHVASLAARFPELVIAPAHDARGVAALPALPTSS